MVLAAGAGRGGGGRSEGAGRGEGGGRGEAAGGAGAGGGRAGCASLASSCVPAPGLRPVRRPVAEEEEKDKEEEEEGWAAGPQAALDAARLDARGAAQTARIGRSGAQARGAEERSLELHQSAPPALLLPAPALCARS